MKHALGALVFLLTACVDRDQSSKEMAPLSGRLSGPLVTVEVSSSRPEVRSGVYTCRETGFDGSVTERAEEAERRLWARIDRYSFDEFARLNEQFIDEDIRTLGCEFRRTNRWNTVMVPFATPRGQSAKEMECFVYSTPEDARARGLEAARYYLARNERWEREIRPTFARSAEWLGPFREYSAETRQRLVERWGCNWRFTRS